MTLHELLTQLGIPYADERHHHGTRGWLQVDCPFCGEEGTGKFHLGINQQSLVAHCWKCGGHSFQKVLERKTNLSSSEIKKLIKAVRRRVSRLDLNVNTTAKRKLEIPKGITTLQRPHRSYLHKRGFNPYKIAETWGVRGIGVDGGKLAWRLWIPIIYQGRTVSWTTRGLSDREPRYISAAANQELIHHKDLLYGEDFVRHTIIIVEGCFDAWKIGKGAVALFGLSYTTAQLNKMRNYPVRVVCFDNSEQAQKAANELAAQLALFDGDTYIVRIESGADPAEADEREIQKLRRRFEL